MSPAGVDALLEWFGVVARLGVVGVVGVRGSPTPRVALPPSAIPGRSLGGAFCRFFEAFCLLGFTVLDVDKVLGKAHSSNNNSPGCGTPVLLRSIKIKESLAGLMDLAASTILLNVIVADSLLREWMSVYSLQYWMRSSDLFSSGSCICLVTRVGRSMS